MSEEQKELAWAIGLMLVALALLAVTSPKRTRPTPPDATTNGRGKYYVNPGQTPAVVTDKPKPSDTLRAWLDDNFDVVPCGCGGGY